MQLDIQKYQKHPLVTGLRDIRSLGLVVFAVIALLVTWSGIKAVQTNYKLEQQIVRLRQENDLQKLQNDNQRLRNAYYNTPQYLELAARQTSGLALPGEKELIVPRAVALAHVKGVKAVSATTISDTTDTAADSAHKHLPFYQRHIQAWMNFFLHRDDTSS